MLTKTDFKKIEELIHKNISNAFSEFFEKVLAPYLDEDHIQNQKEHQQIKDRIENVGEYVKDHEKRITKLEAFTVS